MAYQLGIDIGTTFTAAAVARDGRVEAATLGSRAASIPSVLYLREDGSFLIGEAAEHRASTDPGRVAREFKRRVGDPTPLLLGGTPFSAEALTGKLMRWVVDAIAKREGEHPERIAITHPANWGPFKKDLLSEAIRLADIGDAMTLTEPEAAAIFHATTERIAPGDIVAVYDLGGGTFDAAVLRKTSSGFGILGTPEGIERLGGIDFDEVVFGHVRTALGKAFEELDPTDPGAIAAVARLRRDCVDAKESLSSDTDAAIPVLLPNVQTQVRLTRAEFESMVRPAISETIAALSRSLRSAKVLPADVSAVLLVGGSSRIPLVAQMISSELGRPVAVNAHPKHSVALGAAVAAAAAQGTETADVSPPPEEAAPEAASAQEAPARSEPPPPPKTAPRRGPKPTPKAAPADGTGPPPPRAPATAGPGRKILVGAVAAVVVAAGAFLLLRKDGTDPRDGGSPPSGSPTGQTDGLAFTRITSPPLGGEGDQEITRIVRGGAGYVGAGFDTSGGDEDAAIWRSVDGNRWDRVPHQEEVFGGPGRQQVTGLTESVNLAVGYDAGDAAVWQSPDGGLTWQRVEDATGVLGGAGEQTMNRVVATSREFVAVGYDTSGGDGDAAVWTSTFGTDWFRVDPVESVFGGPGEQRLRAVAGDIDLLVAGGFDDSGGDDDAAVWFSESGQGWEHVAHDEAALGGAGDQQIAAIVAGPEDRLVAVGYDSGGDGSDAAVWTSDDGHAWRRVAKQVFSKPGGQEMRFVTAWEGGFVAVGDDGQDAAVWFSPDGLTWEQPSEDAVLGGSGKQAGRGAVVSGGTLLVVGYEVRGPDREGAVWSAPIE